MKLSWAGFSISGKICNESESTVANSTLGMLSNKSRKITFSQMMILLTFQKQHGSANGRCGWVTWYISQLMRTLHIHCRRG
jgi:hypothetical protein